MLCYTAVMHFIAILIWSYCFNPNVMANETTANVVIDNHNYSILVRPSENSSIVKKMFEARNTQLANVGNMLHLFSHVGTFIRMAHYGLEHYPVLQAELTAFTISVMELNDDSGLMINKFADVCETVLSQFEYAFWYMYHDDMEQAMEELKHVSNAAMEMIEQASVIRDRGIEKRDRLVEYVQKVGMKRNDSLSNKIKLEKEKRQFEAEVQRAETLMKEAEKEEERYYQLYTEVIEQEYDAYKDQMNPFLGILNVATTYFMGKEAVDVTQSRHYTESLSQRAMLYLDKVDEYVEQKHKAMETYSIYNFYSKAIDSDIQINENTQDALLGAYESLDVITLIMNDVVFFWKSTHNYIQFLRSTQLNFNSLTSYIEKKKKEDLWKEDLWKEDLLKERVVKFYSHWVALMNVCTQSLKKFDETRANMRAALTMSEEDIAAKYEELRKNPRLIEHQQN